MIGYKASYNGKCESLTYEVGKTYTFNGILIARYQGLHFWKDAKNVLDYYDIDDLRFQLFKIEVLGKIINEGNKSVTNKIKILEIVPKSDYEELLGLNYNERGNLISQIYPNGDCCQYFYDDRNNLTKKVYPDGKVYQFEYDLNNRVVKQINCYNEIYQYEYDDNGNKIKEIYPDGDIVYFEYDNNDNLTKLTDSNGNIDIFQYKYDNRGNKIKLIYPDGGIRKYEYNENNNLIKDTDADGDIMEYEYDSNNNRIKSSFNGIILYSIDIK